MIWNNLTISKLYFLFVLILLAVTLVAAKGLLANGVAPYMLTVTPFVLLIGQAAYFAFDKFHFKVNVGLARLSNQRAEIQIGADLELSPEGDDLIIDSLIDALKSWRSDTRVEMRQGHRTVLIAGSRTVVIDLSGPETFGKEAGKDEEAESYLLLHIRLTGIESRTAGLSAAWEGDAQLLLETVKETLNPVSGTYTIQINLPDRNPYFGLYIRGAPIDRISSFACAVEEPVGGRQATVNISRNSISVVAYEPFVVVGAARRYLNSPAVS